MNLNCATPPVPRLASPYLIPHPPILKKLVPGLDIRFHALYRSFIMKPVTLPSATPRTGTEAATAIAVVLGRSYTYAYLFFGYVYFYFYATSPGGL